MVILEDFSIKDLFLEIRHLRLIKELAESGTLTAAGKKLFLSQPALSRQLRAVEDELGAALFYRTGKRLMLTQAGKHLHRGACRILHELEQAVTDVKILVNGGGGTLRFVTACYTCYHWLPNLLTMYRKKHPGVEVSINLGATADPIKSLRDGELDMGLVNRVVPGPDLRYHPLFEDEDVLVVPREHRWAKRKFVRPIELSDEHLIVFDSELKESNLYKKILTPAGVTPKHVIRLPMTETIVSMIKAGLGVSVMVRWAAAPYLNSSDLVPLHLTRRGIRRTWYAVTLREDPLPTYIQAFIGLLRESGPLLRR